MRAQSELQRLIKESNADRAQDLKHRSGRRKTDEEDPEEKDEETEEIEEEVEDEDTDWRMPVRDEEIEEEEQDQ